MTSNSTEDHQPEKLFAIVNPVAGSCDKAEVEQSLTEACRAANRDCEIHETAADEDISDTARQAVQRGYTSIVVAGGDGTVSAVATALVNTSTSLAIIPVGTANLLARELEIPLTASEACQLAVTGKRTRAVDVMQIGEDYFFTRISLGVYSRITQNTAVIAKRHFRRLAYIWAAIPELFGGHRWRFDIELDGKEAFTTRAAFIMITNVGTTGTESLRWGPDIAPDDGLIDICIVQARSVIDYLKIFWHVLWQRHDDAAAVSYYQAQQRIRIYQRNLLPVRADGEPLDQRAIDIKIFPAAISVTAPSQIEC